MTVPVKLDLTIRSVTADFANSSLVVNFSLSSFGQPQTAFLDPGTDFTPEQIKGLQDQMEALFAKWVSRQVPQKGAR